MFCSATPCLIPRDVTKLASSVWGLRERRFMTCNSKNSPSWLSTRQVIARKRERGKEMRHLFHYKYGLTWRAREREKRALLSLPHFYDCCRSCVIELIDRVVCLSLWLTLPCILPSFFIPTRFSRPAMHNCAYVLIRLYDGLPSQCVRICSR